MAKVAENGYGGVMVLLSSGLQVHLPALIPAGRGPTIQDIRNLVTALLGLVKDLDDRLEKLEKPMITKKGD